METVVFYSGKQMQRVWLSHAFAACPLPEDNRGIGKVVPW